LIARHASDARAPLAAFTLGRVLLEDLHRPAQAAAAFQRAQELAPGGPLFADAMMRQAEALAASGDAEGARATAQQYLDRFPAGRHATRARSIVER
jgi:transmembrane sensor